VHIEYGTILGDQRLSDDLTLYGVATGTLTVTAGRSLYLYGLCGAGLVVETGGAATILGTVAGDVFNRGTVMLHGIVQGSVHSIGGQFEKSPASVVSGLLEI